MKINIKELAHYIIGGAILLYAWQPLMSFFKNDLTQTGIAWLLVYIVVDQLLHVYVKGEKITIVE